MPKIDVETPAPEHRLQATRPVQRHLPGRDLEEAGRRGGLDQFGVNLVRLPPGKWSSQRHWHTAEDEFVWVLEGEVVLVEDDGDHVLRPGDCGAWKAGERATPTACRTAAARDAVYLEIGTRRPDIDACDYPTST
jgi:uncharacterized cupin superfamily protein